MAREGSKQAKAKALKTSPSPPPVLSARPGKKGHIKRPQNSFILYRKANQDEFEGSGLAQSAISKILGARWRLEPGEVKEVWNAKADMEALQHKRLHPDYKYQPKSRQMKDALKAEAAAEKKAAKQKMASASPPPPPLGPFEEVHTSVPLTHVVTYTAVRGEGASPPRGVFASSPSSSSTTSSSSATTPTAILSRGRSPLDGSSHSASPEPRLPPPGYTFASSDAASAVYVPSPSSDSPPSYTEGDMHTVFSGVPAISDFPGGEFDMMMYSEPQFMQGEAMATFPVGEYPGFSELEFGRAGEVVQDACMGLFRVDGFPEPPPQELQLIEQQALAALVAGTMNPAQLMNMNEPVEGPVDVGLLNDFDPSMVPIEDFMHLINVKPDGTFQAPPSISDPHFLDQHSFGVQADTAQFAPHQFGFVDPFATAPVDGSGYQQFVMQPPTFFPHQYNYGDAVLKPWQVPGAVPPSPPRVYYPSPVVDPLTIETVPTPDAQEPAQVATFSRSSEVPFSSRRRVGGMFRPPPPGRN